MARLVGPSSGQFENYFYKDQQGRLEELIKSLEQSKNKIGMLLNDRSFLEAVAADKRVARLNKLRNDLSTGVKWLGDVHFNADSYFVKRDTSTSTTAEKESAMQSRELLGRLADACFRIYGNCNTAVLRKFNEFDWLPRINYRDTKKIIEMALDKKTNEYNFLIGIDDDSDLFLDEQMYELTSEWSIERNISPPWMEA